MRRRRRRRRRLGRVSWCAGRGCAHGEFEIEIQNGISPPKFGGILETHQSNDDDATSYLILTMFTELVKYVVCTPLPNPLRDVTADGQNCDAKNHNFRKN
jgi:hypothetical protein